jgi:hypothetical protein
MKSFNLWAKRSLAFGVANWISMVHSVPMRDMHWASERREREVRRERGERERSGELYLALLVGAICSNKSYWVCPGSDLGDIFNIQSLRSKRWGEPGPRGGRRRDHGFSWEVEDGGLHGLDRHAIGHFVEHDVWLDDPPIGIMMKDLDRREREREREESAQAERRG